MSDTAGDETRTYAIAGVPFAVSAGTAVLDRVDSTYGAFRATLPGDGDVFAISLSDGEPLHALFNRITEGVVERLAARGIYPIHAAALEHEGSALIISGRSHSGKTTLALSLLGHGFRLLSDELAISAADGRTILPYRRALHVRPGTPELIGELRFLTQEPRLGLGGDIEWSFLPDELESIFPGCLGAAAPLRHVVILGARAGGTGEAKLEPLPATAAAIELVRATPAAANDFAAALARTALLVDGARCVRLHSGTLDKSRTLILDWLAEDG